ncbi:hypothetical protein [Zavarzinia sp. CC-PAN008]|uniref:hypothetical protein n=1 Tax=Zavarzinia sp. CC-PAN008 TaxID=3243332 RepID=UPI003F743A50
MAAELRIPKAAAILRQIEADNELRADVLVRCWELYLGKASIYDKEWLRFLRLVDAKAWIEATIVLIEKVYPSARLFIANARDSRSPGIALGGITMASGAEIFRQASTPGCALLNAFLSVEQVGADNVVGLERGQTA